MIHTRSGCIGGLHVTGLNEAFFHAKIKTEYSHKSTFFSDCRSLGQRPGKRAILAISQKVSHRFSVDNPLMAL